MQAISSISKTTCSRQEMPVERSAVLDSVEVSWLVSRKSESSRSYFFARQDRANIRENVRFSVVLRVYCGFGGGAFDSLQPPFERPVGRTLPAGRFVCRRWPGGASRRHKLGGDGPPHEQCRKCPRRRHFRRFRRANIRIRTSDSPRAWAARLESLAGDSGYACTRL